MFLHAELGPASRFGVVEAVVIIEAGRGRSVTCSARGRRPRHLRVPGSHLSGDDRPHRRQRGNRHLLVRVLERASGLLPQDRPSPRSPLVGRDPISGLLARVRRDDAR